MTLSDDDRANSTSAQPATCPSLTAPDDHVDCEGFDHESVMVDEVVEVLAGVPDGLVFDATVGGGGHAAALLAANDRLHVLGLDRDSAAIRAAGARLAAHCGRFTLHHGRFDEVATVLGNLGHTSISAALFDLGVSSPQLDRGYRGFSYRHEGPLDMRMDRSQAMDAAAIVNTTDERTLAGILRGNADERHAVRIARAIVRARPIVGTGHLGEVVRAAVPTAIRKRRGHPARRTFQALRIEVNQELEILEAVIQTVLSLLCAGGRCVVLSYHSGEDRIVKQVLREATGTANRPRPDLPPVTDSIPGFRYVWRGVRTPEDTEITRNPRSKSARMRAVEKLSRTAP